MGRQCESTVGLVSFTGFLNPVLPNPSLQEGLFGFGRKKQTPCLLHSVLNLSDLVFNRELYLLWFALIDVNIGVCILRKIEGEYQKTTSWAILCARCHSVLLCLHHVPSLRFRWWEVIHSNCVLFPGSRSVLKSLASCRGPTGNKPSQVLVWKMSSHYIPGLKRGGVWVWSENYL